MGYELTALDIIMAFVMAIVKDEKLKMELCALADGTITPDDFFKIHPDWLERINSS